MSFSGCVNTGVRPTGGVFVKDHLEQENIFCVFVIVLYLYLENKTRVHLQYANHSYF